MTPVKTEALKKPEVREKPNDGPPAGKKTSDRAGKFNISIYDAWCKQCGLCADFCPKGVLLKRSLGSPEVAYPEQCVGCMMCVLHCPDFAVNIAAKDEAAEKPEV